MEMVDESLLGRHQNVDWNGRVVDRIVDDIRSKSNESIVAMALSLIDTNTLIDSHAGTHTTATIPIHP